MFRLNKKMVFVSMLVISIAVLGFGIRNISALKSSVVQPAPASFTGLVEKVKPAVVNIRTVKTIKSGGNVFNFFRGPFSKDDPFRDFFERYYGDERHRNFKQRSLGSGFIIDQEGYIVTNNHVVENADKITVVLEDEKEFNAEIIGRDPYTDIALLKIKSEKKFSPVPLGDSDALKVGQWVVAIGNPFGLSQTVTAGIVSAKGRVIGSGPYDDFIQTDASINPGNSGGPLIDTSGEVVGINTIIIAGGQGIGFAIPINLAKGIVEKLKKSGGVARGWLGVTIQDLKEEMAEYYNVKGKEGALVIDVVPGDPADKAGIRPKDIIVAINGKRVKSSRDLTNIVANINVGEKATIKVMRDGKPETMQVKIGKRPDTTASPGSMYKKQEHELGIRVSEITPQIARRFNIKEDSGVIVVDVTVDSKGEAVGILQGDIIIEINRQKIQDARNFKDVLRNIKKGETVAFLIKRAHTGYIVIQMKK